MTEDTAKQQHIASGLRDSPVISVVIPARNEEAYLEKALVALCKVREEEHLRLEIIVGVDRSTDATWEIATRWADTVILAGPGPSKTRNEAASCATGDIIVFLDADTVILPGTLATIAHRLATPGVA